MVFVIERRTQYDLVPITRVKMNHPAENFSIITQSGTFD